jgi:hypothetical protein
VERVAVSEAASLDVFADILDARVAKQRYVKMAGAWQVRDVFVKHRPDGGKHESSL